MSEEIDDGTREITLTDKGRVVLPFCLDLDDEIDVGYFKCSAIAEDLYQIHLKTGEDMMTLFRKHYEQVNGEWVRIHHA